MKLRELAEEHHLDLDLLKEVVEDDLGIKLPKGVDTVLKDEQQARILACDGLETADGKPFAPIIAKEFQDKHNRSLAAKKAAETRKKNDEEKRLAEKAVEDAKIDQERRKHADELKRRHTEEEARAIAEAEAQRLRDAEAAARADADVNRLAAEEDLRKRESEAKRMASEFAQMRATQAATHQAASQQAAAARAASQPPADKPADKQALEKVTADKAPAPAAPTVTPAPEAEFEPVEAPAPVAPLGKPEPVALAESAPVVRTLADSKIGQQIHEQQKADAAKVVPAPVPSTVVKATSGLGSKLASIAKVTHEKADHSIKAVVKPEAPVPGAPQAELTAEDRRRLIQANIARNLEMAKKVQQAKTAARKPGFRPIDRTKTPGGPGAARPGGPPRPGGPARPGGPGRPAPARGGRGRDARDTRTDADGNEGKAGRRFRSTLDEDISGVTEFEIVVPCTVREFSEASGVKSSVIIAKLFMAGVMANINSVLDKDSVELLAQEFKKTVTIKAAQTVEDVVEQFANEDDKEEDLAPRPPVVTIMGHVDHGKTSLLDAIKSSNVVAGEAGGITQHIGAYTVSTKSGMDVTFIDTPGHQAFTEMRARGAQVTDVAVIVVAADDGVMPQTIEAINHAKAAGVAVVVAMNKIDKPEATKESQETVIRQLAENGLQAEEWGGEIAVCRVSAKTGAGLDELLERLALETEVLELRANHFAKANGTVIEARRQEGTGVTATFLVRRGTLAVGDVVLAGTGYGRVRSLTNWKGERVDIAGPSTAVEVTGLSDVPRAGDRFQVMDDLAQAGEMAEARIQVRREKELAARQKTTTAASLLSDIAHSKKKEVRLVVKADTAGSIEVLNKTIAEAATDDVRVTVIHSAVGAVNASDVTLAEASRAMIVGFHVIPDSKARSTAEDLGLEIRTYTIIYELLDDLRNVMSGMLEPETRETIIGHADVRTTFNITKVGTVAGLFITDGVARRDAFMRITRDHKILHTGKVGSLRRFKEDVKEVARDFECGLTVEGFQDIRMGDIFEFYTKEKIARKI
jgi:translation initiation factor IF-2